MEVTGVAERESHKKILAQFIQGLDEKSRAIVSYLWWRRHAEISELRNVDNALDDFEVLFRMKEVINRKSQDLWGRPIVSFEQVKIDPLTGEKVLFNWWFMDEGDISASGPESVLVDVFNEKDAVVIIAQLPAPVDLFAPDIQCKNGILRLSFRKTNI
jgi:hypothetical protein